MLMAVCVIVILATVTHIITNVIFEIKRFLKILFKKYSEIFFN